jgi:hypothetical protein
VDKSLSDCKKLSLGGITPQFPTTGSTIIAAILEKKPILLIYGLFFFILRYIDALIYLGSPIVAFTIKSRGTWVSPKRL